METRFKTKTFTHFILSIAFAVFVAETGLAQASWPAPAPSNIALFKPAQQINTFGAGHANRAVDGNTDGHWHRGSVSHTQGTQNPWWEVNLLEEYDINSITVYNRTDCCSDRLTNFVIRVSKQPFQGNYGGDVFSSDGSTFTNAKTFTNNLRGQYIRIYIEGQGTLSLAEVVVNGRAVNQESNPRPNKNLALGKRARQSSVHDYASANRANDGDRDGWYSQGSVMHTKAQRKPFWDVDLGKNYLVTGITLYNRTDGGQDRLDNFNIYVTKEPINNDNEQRFNPFAQDEKKFSPATFKKFTNNQVGRYVRIQLNKEQNEYLHLAEVEVNGTEIGDINLGNAEANVMYKVSIFRNVTPLESNIKSTLTTTVSQGMDFSRTVSNQHEKHFSLSATARAAVNYGIVSFGLELNTTTGINNIDTTQDMQGSNVTQSSSETKEVTQLVPGGCTLYEFHKFVINQSPITYKFNGQTYSWYRVNNEAQPVGDRTILVLPNNVDPGLNATDENWVLPAYYQQVLQNHPEYIRE